MSSVAAELTTEGGTVIMPGPSTQSTINCAEKTTGKKCARKELSDSGVNHALESKNHLGQDWYASEEQRAAVGKLGHVVKIDRVHFLSLSLKRECDTKNCNYKAPGSVPAVVYFTWWLANMV